MIEFKGILKKLATVAAGLTAMTLASIAATSVAEAGSPAKCGRYAATAVAQQAQNIRNGCGFAGFEWHSNQNAHFTWCLAVGGNARRSGTRMRRRALASCARNQGAGNNGGWQGNGGQAQPAGGSRAACDAYAKQAVRANRTSEALVCGNRGSRWQNNYNRHYRWCRGATRAQRNAETRARNAAVQRCSRREDRQREREAAADNRREAACAGYASTAVSQNRLARRLNCRLRGPRWQNNYARHKNWCKRVSRAASRAETRARQRQLIACGA
ncbi:MAG TPA: hypothetical protein ENJ55_00260 [Rhizobiales bacterium]|nr:hypothetical protein [Hyphomicrobiales bacterium]